MGGQLETQKNTEASTETRLEQLFEDERLDLRLVKSAHLIIQTQTSFFQLHHLSQQLFQLLLNF